MSSLYINFLNCVNYHYYIPWKLFFPHEIIVDGFSAVHQNVLTCAESVSHSQKICPLSDFFRCRPFLQRCLIHYLRPKFRIADDALIQFRQYAAGIQAVTCRSKSRYADRHIFCICQNAAFAGAVFGKFRACVSAGRADIEN